MTRQTKDQFIAEMKKKPQTLGWDVVLAFDRNKTNYLLLQDYISRFGADSLFPPVESSIAPVTGTTHQLHGLRLDKPRLSFENAVITESRARCVMRTVGGHTIETSRPQGTTRDQVKRLGIADGLVGPVLTMTIHLKNAPGGIGSAGKVELNLSGEGAADFTLSGVDTQFEAMKLGEHLNQEIAKWNDEQKKFELSELRQNPDDALQPGTFRILTRPAAGATVRSAEDFGDGEVLLLVGIDDRQGSLPSNNTQIPYLLPQNFSSNLLISYTQLFTRMMLDELKATPQLESIQFDEQTEGGFKRYIASAGQWSIPVRLEGWDGWWFEFDTPAASFSGSSTPLSLRLENGAVVLKWAGAKTLNGKAKTTVINPPHNPEVTFTGSFEMSWDFECRFTPALDKDSEGRTILVIEGEGIKSSTSTRFIDGSGDKAGKSYLVAALPGFGERFAGEFQNLLDKLDTLSLAIDAFRLNGLLFRDETVVLPKSVDWPGDLTVLGDLAPDLTAYKLSDYEVVVNAQGTHTFTVTPANSKLTWSVAPLPGEPSGEANIGKITKNGEYTAPTAASFNFSFRRVVVTATDGTWTGKALVHLVTAPVSVFPLVNVVNLSSAEDQGYLVWAASIQATALTGTVKGNAGGTLTKTDDPDVQSAWRYKAPAVFPSDGTSKLEKVLRVDRVEVAQGGGQAAVCEMILTKTPSQTHFFKHEAVQGGIQFSFWYTDDDNQDVELANEAVEWTKVAGHGVLDEDGKYTPSTTTADHYVVVAAIDLEGGRITLWNFTILPLPLGVASAVEELR